MLIKGPSLKRRLYRFIKDDIQINEDRMSFPLTLSGKFDVIGESCFGQREVVQVTTDKLILKPGEEVVGYCKEKLSIKRGFSGYTFSNKSLLKLGVQCGHRAGVVDSPFSGHLPIKIRNNSSIAPVTLSSGQPIVDIMLFDFGGHTKDIILCTLTEISGLIKSGLLNRNVQRQGNFLLVS